MTKQARTDDELERVFFQRVPPPGWETPAWKNEREQALGELWNRRLASQTSALSQAEIEQLLFYANLEPALGTLGDAARMNLLSAEHCDLVLGNNEIDAFPKAEWTKREIQLRVSVSRFLAQTEAATRRELLHRLLHQTRYWALQAVLHDLSDDELGYCDQCLQDRSVLTRGAREEARQAIRGLRKAP